MAKKLGNDYRLWIDAETPGTFSEILGQTSLSVNRTAALIDTSSKDNAPYGTSAPGLKTVSIDCEIIPDLPDASGYTRLETVALASSPSMVDFAIRKDGSSGDVSDNVFLCGCYVTNFNTTFGKDDVVKCTFTLTIGEAPTTDALA